MKKALLALLVLISSIAATSYARDYVVYDEPEYLLFDEEYIVEEPEYVEYIVEEPVYYVRKPVRKTIIRHEPCVVRYVEPNPAASVFSGLVGFGLGTAFGAAIAD